MRSKNVLVLLCCLAKKMFGKAVHKDKKTTFNTVMWLTTEKKLIY